MLSSSTILISITLISQRINFLEQDTTLFDVTLLVTKASSEEFSDFQICN